MSSSSGIVLEIAVHSVESAVAAQRGGADRIELFSNPLEGGVTPSAGLVAVIRDELTLDIHVMIRPRAGDFHYEKAEFAAMKRDILLAKRLGVKGLVFGVLTLDGMIDVERTRELVDLSSPLTATFHRAFDLCRDLNVALEQLVECGVDRILSSGGKATALEGVSALGALVQQAANRVSIIAGGGIVADNAAEIVRGSSVRELHAGLRRTIPSPMRFRNDAISVGPDGCGPYETLTVGEDDVRRLKKEVEGL
jgi:copper homeostasis protein